MTFSVFKLLFSNVYSFGDFAANFKKGPKGVIKNILIILLALYCIAVFVALFALSMISIYGALKTSGKTYVMPGYGLILGLMITLFFGFLSVATNYYTGSGEEQLLCLPLKPKEIFGGKFALSVVTDSVFAALLMIICAIIYAANEGLFTNPLFYIGVIVSILTVCVVSCFVIYLLFIAVLTLFPALRKKSLMQGIATVIAICFSITCGLMGSMGGNMMAGNPTYDNVDLASPLLNSWIGRLSETKGIALFAKCLIGDWLSILIMLALAALFIFVFVPLVSQLYINSLNGFSDVKSKKLNREQAQKIIGENKKTQSVFKAMYMRDIKTVLREPAFFANGPLMVFLLPIIMMIPLCFALLSNDNVQLNNLFYNLLIIFETGNFADIEKIYYYIALGYAGFTLFTGGSSSIAATSFSREGKGIGNLKALPVRPDTIVLAKFFHAFTYCVLSNLVLLIVVFVVLTVLQASFLIPYLIKPVFLGCILSLVASLLITFLELMLDSVNPKLNWENPMAAFKQNVNSIISIFGTMAFVALFVLVGIILPKTIVGFVIFLVIFTAISAPTGYFCFRHAVKKFIKM